MYQAQQAQMMQNPFLQWLLSGGQGGQFARNPFLNLYQPTVGPGSSATTNFPTPPAAPGMPAPPILPPSSSATVYPGQQAVGASPIGVIPPAPIGAVPTGQGGSAVPGAAGMGDINPAAVPPFVATTPQSPNPLGPAGQSGGGGAQTGGVTTWTYRNGQFFNQANGNVGTPASTDMVQLPGGGPGPNGAGITFAQWTAQGFGMPGTPGAFQQAQMGGQGGRDPGAPQMAGPSNYGVSGPADVMSGRGYQSGGPFRDVGSSWGSAGSATSGAPSNPNPSY